MTEASESIPRSMLDFNKDKLLVLDIDSTLCDFDGLRCSNQHPKVVRPHLHDFLKSVNQYYNIVIWSATKVKFILYKLQTIGMWSNENYEISCILNEEHMKFIKMSERTTLKTKPLSRIWEKFPKFNSSNSLIVDDKVENFFCNPANGILITPYERSMSATDNELIALDKYLIHLAKSCADFKAVDHSKYRNYLNV